MASNIIHISCLKKKCLFSYAFSVLVQQTLYWVKVFCTNWLCWRWRLYFVVKLSVLNVLMYFTIVYLHTFGIKPPLVFHFLTKTLAQTNLLTTFVFWFIIPSLNVRKNIHREESFSWQFVSFLLTRIQKNIKFWQFYRQAIKEWKSIIIFLEKTCFES